MKTSSFVAVVAVLFNIMGCGGVPSETTPCDGAEQCAESGLTHQGAFCCHCAEPPPGCDEDPTEEPPAPPAAPSIPNETFNSITNGVPDGWSASCPWSGYLYADGYGETGSGAILFVVPGCMAYTTNTSAVGSGAGRYRLFVRYLARPALDTPCSTNCARVEAQWSIPGVGVWTESLNLPATGDAWATAAFITSKPTGALSFRPVIVKNGSSGDDVIVDRVAIELVP